MFSSLMVTWLSPSMLQSSLSSSSSSSSWSSSLLLLFLLLMIFMLRMMTVLFDVVVITSFHTISTPTIFSKRVKELKESKTRPEGQLAETFCQLVNRRKHNKLAQSHCRQSDSDRVGTDPPGCPGAKA